MSTFAVTSSKTINLLFFRIALAKHSSCFCPTLKMEPTFSNYVSRPCGSESTICFKLASSNTLSISSSLYSSNGSKLLRILALNTKGTYGIIEILDLSNSKPIWRVFYPSISMYDYGYFSISTILKSA